MDKATRAKLLGKKMTRREFLQFTGSSLLILFGLGNFLALMSHTRKTVEPVAKETERVNNGFGSRKFGV